MIEFPITLTSGGSVCLPGHAFALALGYTKNQGVYRLHVDATGEWEGLTIRAFWHVPNGKDPASSLVVDGYVAVPASVTAQPGNGCVTFEGSDGTRTVTSADLRYRVSANSGTADGTMPEPGTPAWQQLVDAVHTVATDAEQAKTDAQTAAQQAGQALSDTITAKEDALKAIGDKQTSATTAVESAQGKALDAVTDAKNTATQAVGTAQANAIQQMESTKTDALKAIGDKQTAATQAVDAARDKALQQVEASTEAAQTAASEAATSAGNADQSAQEAADSLQELKDGIASGDFKGEPGNDGKSPVVTVTDIENGHRVSITDKDGTKTIDVLNGQAGKDGTQIDDVTVGLDAWSSKHIIDTLCPPISETGNPAQFFPVAGYPLGCKVSWEPTREGSGTPYPAGGGPNLLDISQCTATVGKPYGVTITIDGDVFKVSGVPSSEVTEKGQYSFAVASCTQTELRGKGYKITPFALKGNVSSAWGLRTEDESSLAIAAELTPGVNTDIQLRLMVSKDTPAAYAPYENICPIKGRDSVTVERCGENLLNINPFNKFTKNGITYEYVPNGGIHISGTATTAVVSQTFPVWHLPPGKYYGLDTGEGVSASFVVKRNGKYLWLNAKGIFEILAGDVAKYWCAIAASGATLDKTVYPYIVPGSTPPTVYAPYIGQTATLTLPRTIYGGTVDAVTGDGQETWKITTIDAKKIKFSSYGNDRFWNLPYHTADGATGAPKIICSHFISSTFSINEPYAFFFTQPNRLQNLFSSVDELNDYCAAQYAAGTPVQIVYQSLKESVHFTATGAQPIPALSSANAVLTDADNVTVTGRADPIKRITDLEDAVASMTNT